MEKTRFQIDSQMIRNALAHFDYKFGTKGSKQGTAVITFWNPDFNDIIAFTAVELVDYLFNLKFLLRSIYVYIQKMRVTQAIKFALLQQ